MREPEPERAGQVPLLGPVRARQPRELLLQLQQQEPVRGLLGS